VSDPAPSSAPPLAGVDLVPLGAEALQALLDGDLAAASAAAGVPLPSEFLADTWLWTLRLGQLVGDPACAPWLIRAVVPRADGIAVGHAGFHGPPDEHGMVEVGYRIVPEHRRRGLARAALTELLIFAAAHGARTARASISPDNEASLSLARSFGFVHVGEQLDEIDGLELVFERSLT
jgi:RimJ/RimL family protein N-acetyltransferase